MSSNSKWIKISDFQENRYDLDGLITIYKQQASYMNIQITNGRHKSLFACKLHKQEMYKRFGVVPILSTVVNIGQQLAIDELQHYF